MLRRCGLALLLSTLLLAPSLAGGGKVTDLSADQALAKLKEGNARYVAGSPQHPHSSAEWIEETGRYGQAPFVTVLSCSDSRVPVEQIFDQGVGDVFVVRVAGNVSGVHEAGSIEYGVHHLHTPLLIVLGHSHCGAVTAVVQGAEVHDNIPALVSGIKPAVEKARKEHPDLTGEKLIPAAITANIWQSVSDLLRVSPATRESVASGKTRVIGAMYDLESGKVEWLGEHPQQAELLRAAKSSSGQAPQPASSEHGKH